MNKLPRYFVTLLPRHFVTLLPRHFVTLLLCSFVALTACDNQPKQAKTTESQQTEGFYDTQSNKVTKLQSYDNTSTTTQQNGQSVRMYELPAPLTDRPEMILKRTGFTISYNKTTKTPNWVAWHLTKSHTYGRAQRSEQAFEEDASVGAQRATLDDYYNSRYDRGHMCPAGDCKWSEEAMAQSFLLSNVCPQNHGMNKNAWNDLEIQCRDWAREYGAVDIVCGPIFRQVTYSNGKMKPSSVQRFIGRGKVWVPSAFFKVVLCRGRSPKAIGFVYENRGGQQRISDCAESVDEIERITGIDFFPALDDNTEQRIEAQYRLADW